ncbi:MAG: 23S rRNA (pseudouridine(1915)-N(3))-methyltransferase RlmH [Clostridia bacterium]|nr:23S rRNA (pseudouridine(1915)-N(3))-methyltransferase RlmH [Clostridia bacterium]
MNIQIIAVGTLKESYWKAACAEYAKRLSRFGKLQIIEVAEVVRGAQQDVQKEGAAIAAKIKNGSYVIALCVEGKPLSSEKFAQTLQEAGLRGFGSITFLIGGSDGLSEEVKSLAHLRLSFSEMTFPHQLMRVILLEQVYRAEKILAGESYHK